MKGPGRSAALREAGVIILMAVFLALTYNFFSAHPLPLIRTEPVRIAVPDSLLFTAGRPIDTARIAGLLKDAREHRPDSAAAPLHARALRNPDSVARVAEEDAKSLFRTVTLEQVRKIMSGGRGLLIDARTEEEFRKGHIRGSWNVPGEDIGPHFPELGPLPRDTLIVVYCTGPLCNLGRSLAQFLKTMEFTSVVLYDDGWEGWEKAGLTADTVLTVKGDR